MSCADTTPGEAGGLWVFGYGSLMWRPGFPHDRMARARLRGFHRAFCIISTHHRGTQARPGLVLGLDVGGVCVGMAYHVPAGHVRATRAYLAERELVNGVYREERVAVTLSTGEVVPAQTYVAERAHPSYARLSLKVQARMIRAARGISGNNLDYLLSTLAALRGLGIRELELERVAVLAGPLFGHAAGDGARRPGVEALRRVEQRHPSARTSLPRWQRRRFMFRRVMAIG